MSYFEQITSQSPIWGYDAFGKLRISSPYSIFDSKQCIMNDGGTWDQQLLSGTATFQPSGAQTALAVNATNGAFVIRQTFERMNYTPGKSQNILLTATAMNPQVNAIKRIGYFNSDFNTPYTATYDGYYWQASGTDFSVNIANNGIVESSSQASWNIDKLNGSGPSGKNVTDWSKNQIYGIDFEWLGVGSARFYTVIDGALCYVHQFNHANSTTGVYVSSPNHSIRYELRSLGGAATLNHICSTVQSEGGAEARTINREINNGLAGVNGPNANTEWGVIGFRKDTATVNAAGIGVAIESLDVTSTANVQGGWRLLIDPTVGGAVTWLPVPGASGISYFIGAATNTLTNGTSIAGGFWNQTSKQAVLDRETNARIGVGISGNATLLILSAWSATNTVITQASAQLKLTY